MYFSNINIYCVCVCCVCKYLLPFQTMNALLVSTKHLRLLKRRAQELAGSLTNTYGSDDSDLMQLTGDE